MAGQGEPVPMSSPVEAASPPVEIPSRARHTERNPATGRFIASLKDSADAGPPAAAIKDLADGKIGESLGSGSAISTEDAAALNGTKAPEAAVPAPVAEPTNVTEARQRVAEGKPSPADLQIIEKHDGEVKVQKDLKDAYAAVAGGTATEDQRRMVTEDTTKRDGERVAGRKAEFAAVKAKRKDNGTFDDPADETTYKSYVNEQAEWADLTRREAAGETLSDEDRAKKEEGDKVFKDEDDEAVAEDTEETRLEKIQADLDAATEAMLAEKDPEERMKMMDQVATKRAELMGIKMSVENQARDKKILREVFTGRRPEQDSLISSEKRDKNERVAKMLDQMLADAAELLTISRQLEAIDKQKKDLINKINSEKKRLGHTSTPMQKFVQVSEVVPLYRQLNALDEQSENMAEAGYNFADRYYKNLVGVRRALKARTGGVVLRIMESVALSSLRYSADIQKYSRRGARTLFTQ